MSEREEKEVAGDLASYKDQGKEVPQGYDMHRAQEADHSITKTEKSTEQ